MHATSIAKSQVLRMRSAVPLVWDGFHVVSMAGAGGEGIGTTSSRDCERAFEAADEGGKGYLTREDYKVAVMSLFGYKPSKYELNSVWSAHCACAGDREGAELEAGMNKMVFVQLMAERLKSEDGDQLIRQIFLTFDPQCRGFITLEACRAAFREVAGHVTDGDVEGFFAEVDMNCDGRVSYRDFELMMKHFQLVQNQ